MHNIASRVQQKEFVAFAAYETIQPLWGRIEPMVTSHRRMILTRRYLKGTSHLQVFPGLRLDNDSGRGAYIKVHEEHAELVVHLAQGLRGIGVWGSRRDGSEDDAQAVFRDKKAAAAGDTTKTGLYRRAAKLVEVVGHGQGRDDHIKVTTYNEHEVGIEECLYFDYESDEERAHREASLLKTLEAHGIHTPAQLNALAARVKSDHRTVAELLARPSEHS